MNIKFCIDHKDVPFFQYTDLSPPPPSTKVLLGYVVMNVKIYI